MSANSVDTASCRMPNCLGVWPICGTAIAQMPSARHSANAATPKSDTKPVSYRKAASAAFAAW